MPGLFSCLRDFRHAPHRLLRGSMIRKPGFVWNRSLLAAAVGGMLLAVQPSRAAEPAIDVPSLEELMKVEVSSFARKAQALADTPAAVYVVTAEDIERSGVTSVPEALRLVPGVNVGRISNAMWAVTIRGFNGRFANKLLVMIDGRSVYSPLFSGTLWEAQDTLLEDIDRIEVIRGPGAAMWGANAVNGVINIITKRARSTQGTQVVAAAGTTERAAASLRHGVALDGGAHLRLYAKGFSVEPSETFDGGRGRDEWNNGRVGLRFDKSFGTDKLTVLADAFEYRFGDRWVVPRVSPAMTPPYLEALPLDEESRGANLLARFEWVSGSGVESAMQASYARSSFNVDGAVRERRDTLDLEFQQRRRIGRVHDMVWGLASRFSTDDIRAGKTIAFAERSRNSRSSSVFVRDEIALVPHRWNVTFGARLEHDDYSGLHFQPDTRLSFTPTPNDTFWLAASRAVRTPSRGERDATMRNYIAAPGLGGIQTPIPTLLPLEPSEKRLAAEKLSQLDFGWRGQLGNALSVDVAAFFGRYRDLVASRMGNPSPILAMTPAGVVPVGVTVPVLHDDETRGTTRGLEIAADWRVRSDLRVQASYSYLDIDVDLPGNPVGDAFSKLNAGSAPRHQGSLRVSWDVFRSQRADLWLRSASKLRPLAVSGYTELDLRYAWKLGPRVELSLVGQNLLDSRHPEYVAEYLTSEPLQVRRGAYAKIKVQF